MDSFVFKEHYWYDALNRFSDSEDLAHYFRFLFSCVFDNATPADAPVQYRSLLSATLEEIRRDQMLYQKRKGRKSG